MYRVGSSEPPGAIKQATSNGIRMRCDDDDKPDCLFLSEKSVNSWKLATQELAYETKFTIL